MTDMRVETARGVMTITLSRPTKKNALTDAMYGEFIRALTEASQDPGIRAVVVTGDGADFCAGNDIGMFSALAAGDGDIEETNVVPFLATLAEFPKPLIAAVLGRAIGIGATMLLHCDLVYVADDATLSFSFVDLGLVPEAGSSRLLPARIGHVRASALFMLCDPLTGPEAATLGLANAALPAPDVLRAAHDAAGRLSRKSPSALATTKALMRDADAIAAAIQADDEALARQLLTPEAAAAFAAFEKRRTTG